MAQLLVTTTFLARLTGVTTSTCPRVLLHCRLASSPSFDLDAPMETASSHAYELRSHIPYALFAKREDASCFLPPTPPLSLSHTHSVRLRTYWGSERRRRASRQTPHGCSIPEIGTFHIVVFLGMLRTCSAFSRHQCSYTKLPGLGSEGRLVKLEAFDTHMERSDSSSGA